jgi:ElaB/YqjD/DUF883 family membrane-anchored ribosome-binding protein
MDAHSGVRPKTGPAGSDAAGATSDTGSTGQQNQQKGDVSELVDQAKRTATETASGAGNMVRQRIDDQYHRLGQRLDDMVKNMNQAADSLDKGGSPGAGNLIHGATRQMERVTGYVERTSAEDIISDASQYAKQHPWTVIAGGVVAGLIASRFLKAAMPSSGGGSPIGRSSNYQAGSGYESGTSHHAAV